MRPDPPSALERLDEKTPTEDALMGDPNDALATCPGDAIMGDEGAHLKRAAEDPVSRSKLSKSVTSMSASQTAIDLVPVPKPGDAESATPLSEAMATSLLALPSRVLNAVSHTMAAATAGTTYAPPSGTTSSPK
jgi:hypothetical protein